MDYLRIAVELVMGGVAAWLMVRWNRKRTQASRLEQSQYLEQIKAVFIDRRNREEAIDAVWLDRMDELDRKLEQLRPEVFDRHVEQLRVLFASAFSEMNERREARIDAIGDLLSAQVALLSSHHAELEKHRRELEAQWHRLDTRVRAIVQIADAFRVVRANSPSQPAVEPLAPLAEPDLVEVIGPEGGPQFYPTPSRADEPVHPEIQRALHTPGWKIRYPDGREEAGIA